MNRKKSGTLLETERLRYGYRSNRLSGAADRTAMALHDLGLAIGYGEILGLAGESGSGKSTLARLLCQLLQPDGGEIRVDGVALQAMDAKLRRETRRRIQIIFQDPSASLSPRRTIRSSLREPLDHFAIGAPGERERLAAEALEAVGLDEAALPRLPHQFSSGQRQRISIARALLVNPDLVIADEAVSSLDVSVQAQMIDLLARLREERGIALLFISHDLAVIGQLADKVGVLLAGRLVEYGAARDLLDQPAHPYTQALLSAVTDPDPAVHRNRSAAAGQRGIGFPDDWTGCAYQSRCPLAVPACRQAPPATRPVPGQHAHEVKCYQVGESDLPTPS